MGDTKMQPKWLDTESLSTITVIYVLFISPVDNEVTNCLCVTMCFNAF